MSCKCVAFRSKLEKFRWNFSRLCSCQIRNGVEKWWSWRESNNSGRKRMFSYVKGAKKEWKRCHKHIYLESNIFKVQRCVCVAHDSVPLITFGIRSFLNTYREVRTFSKIHLHLSSIQFEQ